MKSKICVRARGATSRAISCTLEKVHDISDVYVRSLDHVAAATLIKRT
jgi:hypothetical protein